MPLPPPARQLAAPQAAELHVASSSPAKLFPPPHKPGCTSALWLFSAFTVLVELPRHHPHQPPLQYFNLEPKSSRNFSPAILHCILVSPSRSKQAALHLIPKNIALVFILSYGLAVSLLTYRIPCVIFAFSPPPPGISTHYSISGERLPKSCQLCPPSPSAPIKGEPILSIQVLSPHKVPSIRDVQIFPLHVISLPTL